MSNQASKSLAVQQPISARAYKYCSLRASGASRTAAARGAGYKHPGAAAAWLESQPLINQIITRLVNRQGRTFVLDAEERARLLSAIAADTTATPADRIRALQLLQRIEEFASNNATSGGISVSWGDNSTPNKEI